MTTQLSKAIARIRQANGKVVGAGFLVSDKYILTCAHVVNAAALGRRRLDDPDQPDQEIHLDFPLVASGKILRGRLVQWIPVQPSSSILPETGADVALLELEDYLPKEAQPVRLVRAENLWKHPFRVFGFPEGKSEGVWTNGIIRERQANGRVHIEILPSSAYHIEPGFSGSPVWDEQLDGVAGMTVAIDPLRPKSRAAFMTSTTQLINACPELKEQAIPPCPYRGLFAFREQDAQYFFGRETFTQQLVQAVQRQSLVAVIGASGSGKSSVVFAGLIPQLRSEEGWLIEAFRPGDRPLQNLAARLVPLLETEMTETDQLVEVNKQAKALQHGELGLQDVIKRILEHNSGSRLLLIADQFEELYTHCKDNSERQLFLDQLLEAVNQTENFTLVLTLRADFLGYALSYRPFADALQDADLKLGPMNHEELQEAIEKPAQLLGVRLESGLTESILKAVEKEPGNLPLLEFALTLLWEKQKNGQLTHQAYEDIGGVEKALAQHAQEKYEALNEKDKQRAQRVFIQLVRPGEGTEDTRRLATRDEVGEDNWDLVTRKEGLADARLVVTNEVSSKQVVIWAISLLIKSGLNQLALLLLDDYQTKRATLETVEIIHEALIREWGTLRGWMDDNREFRTWQERLMGRIREWKANRRDEGSLLRGTALGVAEEWLHKRREELSHVEQDFIQQSLALRDREKADRDRQIREKEQQRQRELDEARKRIRQAFVAIFIISGFAIFAGLQWRQAEIEQIRTLRTSSEALLGSNTLEGLKESLRAAKKLKHPLLKVDVQLQNQVIATLQKMVYRVNERKRLAVPQSMILNATFSHDGRRVVTTETDGIVRLWDLSGKQLDQFKAHSGRIMAVSFSPNGRLIATGGYDQAVRLWDLSGNQIAECLGHSDEVWTVSFSPDGSLIASASKDKTARLWDLDCNQLTPFIGHTERLSSVSFSPDGKLLATSGKDGTTRLWNLQGQQLKKLSGHRKGNWVYSVSFSPNGRLLADTGGDGSVCLWDYLKDNPQCDRILAHTGWASWLSFSPDGKFLATSGEDGTARLWNLKRQKIAEFTGHLNRVMRLSFQADGKLLVTVGEDGTARLWDLEGQQLVKFTGFGGPLSRIRFSPNGKLLATAEEDGTARLWELNDKNNPPTVDLVKVFPGHQGPVTRLSFSPDRPDTDKKDRFLATTGIDGIIQVWNLNNQKLHAKFKGHEGVIHGLNFSPNGRLLATAGQDRIARLWDLNGNQIADDFVGHERVIWSVVFTPDGQRLVTSSDDGTTRFWDLKGKELNKFKSGHLGGGDYVSISPDGSLLATSGYHGIIELWNLSGTEVKRVAKCEGTQQEVQELNFSSNSQQLATAHTDGTARVWNFSGQSCQQLAEFKHGTWVDSVSFSPDGKLLATASSDGTAKLWQIESFDDLMKRGCDWINEYQKNDSNVSESDKKLCPNI